MTKPASASSKTFRLLALTACLAASAHAAAEWTTYYRGSRSIHYFNPQSIRHGGEMRWVSELTGLTTPDADGTRSIVTSLEIDCANGQFRVQSQARYRKPKAKGPAAARTPGVGGSAAISPGTAIDSLAGRVCS